MTKRLGTFGTFTGILQRGAHISGIEEYGTLQAFEMSGKNPATVLRGYMQLMVAVYMIMFPKCT